LIVPDSRPSRRQAGAIGGVAQEIDIAIFSPFEGDLERPNRRKYPGSLNFVANPS
jgi:hypothetical protein